MECHTVRSNYGSRRYSENSGDAIARIGIHSLIPKHLAGCGLEARAVSTVKAPNGAIWTHSDTGPTLATESWQERCPSVQTIVSYFFLDLAYQIPFWSPQSPLNHCNMNIHKIIYRTLCEALLPSPEPALHSQSLRHNDRFLWNPTLLASILVAVWFFLRNGDRPFRQMARIRWTTYTEN